MGKEMFIFRNIWSRSLCYMRLSAVLLFRFYVCVYFGYIETFPVVCYPSYGREVFMDNTTGILSNYFSLAFWCFAVKLGNICRSDFDSDKIDFMISSMTQTLRHSFVKYQ